jgi:hypothetical protein
MKLSPPPMPAFAEHQVDVIAGVPLQQLTAKPQDLRLVGDVAGMAGDPDAGRGARPRRGRGIRDGVCVQVTCRSVFTCHLGALPASRHAGPGRCLLILISIC